MQGVRVCVFRGGGLKVERGQGWGGHVHVFLMSVTHFPQHAPLSLRW